MLAQAFLDHKALGLPADEHRAFVLTLHGLETNSLPGFDMSQWPTCIGGAAERLGNLPPYSLLARARVNAEVARNTGLRDLFMGRGTREQAAHALRSYLRTGEDGWQDAREGR